MRPTFKKERYPPMGKPNGLVIASLKDLFRLVDNYPTKKAYTIAWHYVFQDYDWVFVSPRVIMRDLDSVPEFDQQIKSWKGNLVYTNRYRKLAKLTQPLPEHFDGEFRVNNFFGKRQKIVGYVSDGVTDSQLQKCRGHIIKALLKIKSVNLDWIHKYYWKKILELKINIISDGGNWTVNYANSVIEFNAKTFSTKSARESMLIVLKGLSLAYFSHILRNKDMRKWFKFIKKENPPVKNKDFKPDITKLQRAWASGMSFYVMGVDFPIKEAWEKYHKMMRDFDEQNEDYSVEDFILPDGVTYSTEEVVEEIGDSYPSMPFKFGGKELYDVMGLGDVFLKTDMAHMLSIDDNDDQKLVYNDVSSGEVTAFIVETEASEYEEGWQTNEGEHLMTVSRTVWWNESEGTSGIENDHFKLSDQYHGQGVGMAMIGRQIEFCLYHNVDKISCYAARDGGEGYVGYKVWHKMGYDAAISMDDFKYKGDAVENTFFSFVHKSLERKILDYPEDVIHGEMNKLLQTLTKERTTKAFRELPPQYEDRFLEIRYGDEDGKKAPNNYADLVSEMKRVEIYEFIVKFGFHSNLPNPHECAYFESKRTIGKSLSSFRLHPTLETIQNLMDLAGFESFWAENGNGFTCQIDLREGRSSEAYMIFALYKQKKGMKLSGGDVVTKAMGTLSAKDIALMAEARNEIRMKNRSVGKLATKWLL